MALMRLTAWEEERLLIFSAAELARRTRAAGVRLNAPEAIALVCDAMLAAARAGRSYAEIEAAGLAAVGAADVMDGVRELVDEIRLEVLVGDGTRLVVLVDPLGRRGPAVGDGPGAFQAGSDRPDDPAAAERERRSIRVRNGSVRVVRVSSHYPFDRVNPRLAFDRAATVGFHLDRPAGTSERWEPGEEKEVEIVRYGGLGGEPAGADPAAPAAPAPGRSSPRR